MPQLIPAQRPSDESLLREDRAFMGLSPKQYAYCELRVKGRSVLEAYIEAYKPETENQMVIRSASTDVEANPRIQARIRGRLKELQGDMSGLPVIGKDFVITGIAALAIGGEKEATRLKGYELLGKALGLFDRGPEQVEAPKTVNDIDAKLRDLLRTTMGASPAPVIDGEVLPEPRPDIAAGAAGQPELRQDRRRKPKHDEN